MNYMYWIDHCKNVKCITLPGFLCTLSGVVFILIVHYSCICVNLLMVEAFNNDVKRINIGSQIKLEFGNNRD